jgi:hypothetical protein
LLVGLTGGAVLVLLLACGGFTVFLLGGAPGINLRVTEANFRRLPRKGAVPLREVEAILGPGQEVPASTLDTLVVSSIGLIASRQRQGWQELRQKQGALGIVRWYKWSRPGSHIVVGVSRQASGEEVLEARAFVSAHTASFAFGRNLPDLGPGPVNGIKDKGDADEDDDHPGK